MGYHPPWYSTSGTNPTPLWIVAHLLRLLLVRCASACTLLIQLTASTWRLWTGNPHVQRSSTTARLSTFGQPGATQALLATTCDCWDRKKFDTGMGPKKGFKIEIRGCPQRPRAWESTNSS
jgi:hypothetical protein